MAGKPNRMHHSHPPITKLKNADKDLVVIGSKNSTADNHRRHKAKNELSNVPMSIEYEREETDESDHIEEIELSPIKLLHQATETRDPTFYYKALTVETEKRALEERANQLKHRLEIELRIKSRKLASRYFGWEDVPWRLPSQQSRHTTLNDMWGALRQLSDHEYALQDPHIAEPFFNNLRQMITFDDLERLQNQWGAGYQIQDYFHEYPAIWKAQDTRTIKHGKPKKKVQKSITNTIDSKKSIIKQKLEEDIAKREAELLIEMNRHFKANPIPVSSLIPKYKMIMSTKGNKATEMRHMATEKKRAKIQAKMSIIVEDALFDVQKDDSKLKAAKITSPTIIDAGNEGRRRRERLEKNEKNAGLTTEHTFQPVISKNIPDYKKLQSEFNAKLEKKKSARPPTVPIPFSNVQKHQEEGHAYKLKKVRDIIHGEQEDIQKNKINRMPYYNSAIPPSTIGEHPHETKAWKLTVEHRKAQEAAEKERLKLEREQILSKKERSKEVAAKLRAKLFLHDKQTSDRHNDSAERFKQAQKQRAIEHRKQLKEMNKRIDQRLALFEQSEIASAKEKVKREFKQVLETEGLSGIDF